MKKILNIILSIIIVFSYPSISLASNSNNGYIIEKSINSQQNNLVISGNYPNVTNLKNASFQKTVNSKIDDIIKSQSSSYLNDTSKKITLSYDIIQDNNYLSIILYFKNTYTDETDIKSINIDVSSSSFITINTILNVNGLSYVNKVVSNKASDMNVNYKKITEDTPFYVKNGNIYVCFGAGEITFVKKGNITFEILSKNLINYKIPKDSYYKKSEYNVKMVPLRSTLEFFGYTAIWDYKSNAVTVSKDNTFVSYIVIGSNKYSKYNKFIRQLEFAPELKNGSTYVPISFFSQILDMLFAVDNNENIIISSYKLD